jgi:hypothetical protein
MSEERLNSDLAAIEAALCSLTPAASNIQRDRLMFLAGRASANRVSAFGVRRFIAAFRKTAGIATRCGHIEKKAAIDRRTPRLLWPMATVASLLLATMFAILWAKGNNAAFVEQPLPGVSIAAAALTDDIPDDTSPPSPWANRRLCQLVLEKGVDAMPESSVHGVSGTPFVPRDESYRSLLKQFLDNPTG